MKSSLVFCCVLLAVSARQKDKKLTLEDVEKEYRTTQKRTSLTPPPAPKSVPAQSPTQYGFVPVKTLANYLQQEPKFNHFPATYITRGHQQQYSQNQQQYQTQPDYASAHHYTSTVPQKYSAAPQIDASQYSGPQQKYTVAKYNQPSVSYTQPQADYQSYENVQYVTDNNIAQHDQQLYTPQYVYLQQYQAPSTAVQTVVDPKGTGLQYVMYVPTYVPNTASDQSQTYDNVVYTTNAETTADYQVPETTHYQPKEAEQHVHVQPQETVIKREPKSLLDSYVPSYLQLQYYHQAQAQRQQNVIQDVVKIPRSKSTYRPTTAESSVRHSYRPSIYKT